MIHILWATLRPEQFITMHTEWINRSNNSQNIKTYVCVNWKQHADSLREYLKNDYLITLNSNKIGVCYPCYQLSSNLGKSMGNCSNDDIVVFASDDFLPPHDWDKYLINKLKDKTGVLMVRDGFQLPDSSNMLYPAITIPIMTYDCLIALNRVIYHPAFNHMFSDVELYFNAKDLGLLLDDRLTDETTFEHLHHASGKRKPDNADAAYYSKWKDDEVTWNKRKLMPVEKRIEV
jgi:hypothetical protein